AKVYCNCYEQGRLREPPPAGVTLSFEEDGSVGATADDGSLESLMEFDTWYYTRAYEHEAGTLVSHFLGNIALIGLLRHELQRVAAKFPVLLTKVIYNGVHCGDFMPLAEIPDLQQEVGRLENFQCSSWEAEGYVAKFRDQMAELVTAALSVGKPIV